MRTAVVSSTALLLAACAVGPDYQSPPLPAPAALRGTTAPPASGEPGAAGASLADQSWWELFADPALRALIGEALRSGHDLRLAAARVAEARATAGLARAERWPAVQGTAGWSRGRPSSTIVPGGEVRELYDARLGVSWELDLWGRIRRLEEGALAAYLAREEARRGVMLSLVAEVASGYFQLRTLDLQLQIARRTSTAFAETHALFDRRLEAGLASSLETASAGAALAATAATIPDLERRIVGQENRLALLLGRHPGEVTRGMALEDQPLPPEIPAGLPAELLRRRPDLRQAEQELVAANAAVGVAVADYFPRLALTGLLGGVAPEVSALFGDGETWSVGGGLLTPLLQGGRLRNQQRAALARREQALVRYERSVNEAFAEVSTALVAYQRLAEVEREQARAVAAHRDAVELASSRYLSGLADYLEVLQAQQQLFPAENTLAETRFARLATLVQLYRALGGGWRLGDEEWTGASAAATAAAR